MNRKLKKTVARVGLVALKPLAQIASLIKTNLSYDSAIKEIKKVYPWNESDFNSLRGGKIIKPLLLSTIDVSFIVPCYNAEKFIEKCILSLLNQKTSVSYEIICVNDGSTDNTLEVLNLLKERSGGKIKVISEENQGISAARNLGIVNAKGKYLGFIDDDDFVEENYLEILIQNAKKYSSDIVQIAFDNVDTDGNLISKHNIEQDFYVSDNPLKIAKCCYGFVWSGLIKKELFKDIRFPYKFWYEDMILIMALIRLCRVYSYSSSCLYHHTIRTSSASNTLWNYKNHKSLDQLLLPLLIVKYSSEVLALSDDDFIFRRLLHEYSSMLYSRTKGLSNRLRKSAFVVASKILKDYKQEIDKSSLSNFERASLFDFENQTFLKWTLDGMIYRLETTLENGRKTKEKPTARRGGGYE